MRHLNYDNIIPTSIQRKEASLAESSQYNRRTVIIPFSSVLLHDVRQLIHRMHIRFSRLSKFLVVGGTGMLVNSLMLVLLFQWAHMPLIIASALSTEVAIVNNFCWNDRWTFGRTQFSLSRFTRFNLVSLVGLIITAGTLWVLVRHL